ncbi:MAG: (2Fe-2S)-binding protein [Planctomycetota bacterium]
MIPELPHAYVDHLVAPRHLGDVPDAEAAGEKGSMVGGMGVRITLAYRAGPWGDPEVGSAAARVFGSAAPIAPASRLMERIHGLSPEEALAIRVEDLLEDLAGAHGDRLPAPVHKGATFLVEALHGALGAPDERPSDPTGPGILVCRCIGVGDRPIREAIRRGAWTPEAVADLCRAGTGCRSCRPDVLALIHEERTQPGAAPPADLDPVLRIVHSRVRRLLGAHGVGLRDASVTEDLVRLRLAPIHGEASLSPRGAQELARHLLRETVWDGIRVSTDPAA